MFQIATTFDEVVEAQEECGVHNVPATVGAVLVILVDHLEAAAGLTDLDEHAVRLSDVVFGQFGDELRPVELAATLGDDFVADLAYERDQVGVALLLHRVGLDQHDEVHHRYERVLDLADAALLLQSLEVFAQSGEVLEVVT